MPKKATPQHEEEATQDVAPTKKLLRSSEDDSFDLEVLAWGGTGKKRAPVTEVLPVKSVTTDESERSWVRSRFEELAAAADAEKADRDRAYLEWERAIEAAGVQGTETVLNDVEREVREAFAEAEALERQAQDAEARALAARRPHPSGRKKQRPSSKKQERLEEEQPEVVVSVMPSKRVAKAAMRRPELEVWKRRQRLLAVLEAQRESRRRRLAMFGTVQAAKEYRADKGRERLERDDEDALEIARRRKVVALLKQRRDAAEKALDVAGKAMDAANVATEQSTAYAAAVSKKLATIARNKLKRDRRQATLAANRALAKDAETAALNAAHALAQLEHEEASLIDVSLVYTAAAEMDLVVDLRLPGDEWATKPASKLLSAFRTHTTCPLPPRLALETSTGVPLASCTVEDAITFGRGVLTVKPLY